MGLFDWLFGSSSSTVYVETQQTAQQAANVTVNPTTNVSLAIDTDNIADALMAMTKEHAEIAGREEEILKQSYQATLALGLANLGLLAQDAEYTKAELSLDAQSNTIAATAVANLQAMAGDFYKLFKVGLIGLGTYLLLRGR